MTHAVDVGLVVSLASGVLYLILGAWVLTLTPRRRQTTLLGSFLVLFGLVFAPTDVLVILDVVEPFDVLQLALQDPMAVLAAVAALGLAASVPRPVGDRRLLGVSLGVGLLLSSAWTMAFLAVTTLQGPGRSLHTARVLLAPAVTWAAFILLALRAAPSRDPSVEETTQLALLAAAFALFWAFVHGMDVVQAAGALATGSAPGLIVEGMGPVVWLLVAALWGRNMVQAPPATARIHRATMLAILGMLAAGAVYRASFPGGPSYDNVALGVVRTLGVALLAYGILRHDLAGLDAKVEWTVSKTTVAGIFVAVFFIVSEGAQVLFAGFARSELLGIVAAGALLFVLSPIQRAADRIAERAVPGSPDGEGPGDPEALYRSTAARFLADGELTEDEEEMLAQLATRLGIDASRAFELRREARSDREGGDAP